MGRIDYGDGETIGMVLGGIMGTMIIGVCFLKYRDTCCSHAPARPPRVITGEHGHGHAHAHAHGGAAGPSHAGGGGGPPAAARDTWGAAGAPPPPPVDHHHHHPGDGSAYVVGGGGDGGGAVDGSRVAPGRHGAALGTGATVLWDAGGSQRHAEPAPRGAAGASPRRPSYHAPTPRGAAVATGGPSQWTRFLDDASGCPYWYDNASGVSTWIDPATAPRAAE